MDARQKERNRPCDGVMVCRVAWPERVRCEEATENVATTVHDVTMMYSFP